MQIAKSLPLLIEYLVVGVLCLLGIWVTTNYFAVVLPPERVANGLSVDDIFSLPTLNLLLFLGSVLYGLASFFWRPWTLADYAPVERWLLVLLVGFQVHACAFMEYNHYYDQWFLWGRTAVAVFAVIVLLCPAFIPAFLIVCALMTSQVHIDGLFKYDHNHKALIEPTLMALWAVGGYWHLFRRRLPHLSLYIMLSVLATWYLRAGIGKWELNWHDSNNVYNMYATAHSLHWHLTSLSEPLNQWVGRALIQHQAVINYFGILIECLFPLLFVFRRWLSIVIFAANIGLHLVILLLSGIFFYQWVCIELLLVGCWLFKKRAFQNFWGWKPTLLLLVFILVNWRFSGATKLAWIDSNYVETYRFVLDTDRGRLALDPSFFSPYDYSFNQNRFYFINGEQAFTGSLGGAVNQEVIDLLNQPLSAEQLRRAIADFREANDYYEPTADRTDAFIAFLTTSIRNKMAYDPKVISYLSPMNHIQSDVSQKNVVPARPRSLTILHEDRRMLPDLQYEVIRRDSLVIPLDE